jgi:hypothetical protein
MLLSLVCGLRVCLIMKCGDVIQRSTSLCAMEGAGVGFRRLRALEKVKDVLDERR